MDKQKQILTEELIGIIQGAVGGCATHWASLIAEEVLKYYQPKIPEGAVVVPNMAGKDFYTIEKTEWDKMVQGAKDIIHEKEEKVAEKFAEKFKEKMKAKYQGTGLWWTEIVLMANEIAKEFTGDKS